VLLLSNLARAHCPPIPFLGEWERKLLQYQRKKFFIKIKDFYQSKSLLKNLTDKTYWTGNQIGTLTKITIWYFPEEEIYFANNHMKQFSN
jgi:hypothetical protein